MRFARGMLTVDVSGRYYTQNNPQTPTPVCSRPAFSSSPSPFIKRSSIRIRRWVPDQRRADKVVDKRSRWVWTASAMTAQATTAAPVAADTLLSVSNSNQTKASIAYNTSFQGSLARECAGSLTAGFDHYSLPNVGFFTGGARHDRHNRDRPQSVHHGEPHHHEQHWLLCAGPGRLSRRVVRHGRRARRAEYDVRRQSRHAGLPPRGLSYVQQWAVRRSNCGLVGQGDSGPCVGRKGRRRIGLKYASGEPRSRTRATAGMGCWDRRRVRQSWVVERHRLRPDGGQLDRVRQLAGDPRC